ncbi:MAG: hypothetical protein ABIO39_13610 [Caulobacteraceae bacterium]
MLELQSLNPVTIAEELMVVITPERTSPHRGAAIVQRGDAPLWLQRLNWRLILALTLNVAAWVGIGVLVAKLI